MARLKLPAAKVTQGDLTLFSTAIAVENLVEDGFYSVETLDPSNSGDKGFQRLLNQSRARKLADYMVKGQENQDAFLPTSVFLATDKNIEFDTETNTIEFDTREIGAFSVVDGQHRLEGLKLAASKDDRIHKFKLPVNIAVNLPQIHQMCHFLIVNTTQKSVDKAVEQKIVSRLTEALDVEEMPTLPQWILRVVQKGEVDKAVKLLTFLNDEPESPWYKKIKMANEADSRPIRQGSFVKMIVKYVFTANNPISVLSDPDKERRIFLNYWKAITETIDDSEGSATVLYKYNGALLFCQFSIPFFTKLQERGDYTVETMKSLLVSCFDNVEGDSAGVGHAEWWVTRGKASGMNTSAMSKVATEMTRALHNASMSDDIKI